MVWVTVSHVGSETMLLEEQETYFFCEEPRSSDKMLEMTSLWLGINAYTILRENDKNIYWVISLIIYAFSDLIFQRIKFIRF